MKQIFTYKSHNIKQVWNTKTSHYHITATPHYYRKIFCSYSYILVVHFTASTIWSLQKLGLVGMVSYHYIRGVQPFAIAGHSTFIYMRHGRQWVRVIFMRYVCNDLKNFINKTALIIIINTTAKANDTTDILQTFR